MIVKKTKAPRSFPHDVNAVHNVKIDAMRALYGNDGYAFYFILLELIHKNGGTLSLNAEALRSVVKLTVTEDVDLFDRMMDTATDLGLFDGAEYNRRGILTLPGRNG